MSVFYVLSPEIFYIFLVFGSTIYLNIVKLYSIMIWEYLGGK